VNDDVAPWQKEIGSGNIAWAKSSGIIKASG
jgi:hypothetical protein